MEISYSRNDKIIRRKFYQYLIPTVLMILAMQFGSLADAIVVGNMLGGSALSATSLALPVVFLVELPGFAIAAGAGIVGANLIGKRKIDEASKVFKISLLSSFVISLIFLPLAFVLADPIATFFAGNFVELKEMVRQYVFVYMVQAPFLGLGLVVGYFLPSDNSPVLGALFFLFSNIGHLGTEILFAAILPSDVAMYGIAASMGVGMICGLIVLIPYAKSKHRSVNFKTPLAGSWPLFRDVLRSGSSTAAYTGLNFIYTLVLNLAATAYLTASELSVYAMLSNFTFVIDLFVLGILQVMPSVIPALYGEKDYFSIRAVMRHIVLLVFGVAATLMIISLIFPALFFGMFGVDLNGISQGFITGGSMNITDPLFVVRIYVVSFLIYAANKLLVTYFPSIMINAPGVLSNVVRVGVIGPVAIYFLMQALGVMGYAFGAIIMEAGTLLVVLGFIGIGKRLHRFTGQGILLLPKAENETKCLDITIPAKEEEISKSVEELQRFAYEMSKDERASAMLAVAAEEIVANIILHGYAKQKNPEYIDITMVFDGTSLLLRVRDDGSAFDPTHYVSGQDEENRYRGIEIVRKVADELKYLRVLNTNNTIIEVRAA